MNRLIKIFLLTISVAAILVIWNFNKNFRDIAGVFGGENRFVSDPEKLAIVIHHTAGENGTLEYINTLHKSEGYDNREQIQKIRYSLEWKKRVPKWKAWALSVFACVITAYLCSVYDNVKSNFNVEKTVLTATFNTEKVDYKKVISDFENKKTFYVL